MCRQQGLDGASLWERKACPGCPITNTQPEVGLERLVDLSTISNVSTSISSRVDLDRNIIIQVTM